ncbi:unnamed protein product [Symbiodinium necroappetens]|uniref:Uncharacterized protein n=1 Tax=Symbiodinium necroappetens TaxID=1628268 RepID=A0A812U482_9DINO|nr:unnamed protein product [Symbiodinium necroappetens]
MTEVPVECIGGGKPAANPSPECPPSFRMALHCEAAREVVAKHCKGLSWGAYFCRAWDLASVFTLMVAAVVTSNYVLIAGLLVLFLLAVVRVGLRRTVLSPIFMLVPEGSSIFGLADHQRSARCFNLVHVILKTMCLMLAVYAFLSTSDTFSSFRCYGESGQDCSQAPDFLQSMCRDGNFSAPDYISCTEQHDFWLEGNCNVNAAYCPFYHLFGEPESSPSSSLNDQLTDAGSQLGGLFLYLSLMVGPFLCFGGSLCWAVTVVVLHKKCPWAAPPSPTLREEVAAETQRRLTEFDPNKASMTGRAWILFDFGCFVFDIGTDFNTLLTYAATNNTAFFFAQAFLFLLALMTQCRFGFRRVWTSFQESFAVGKRSDAFMEMTRMEKSCEAPLAMLLQYYAFWFLVSSRYAVFTAAFGMALSFRGMVSGSYELIHLSVADKLYHSQAVQPEPEEKPTASG